MNVNRNNLSYLNIGQNMKIVRKRAKHTQAKTADALGVDVTYISKLENGVCIPGIKLLISFSEIYVVTLDELVVSK